MKRKINKKKKIERETKIMLKWKLFYHFLGKSSEIKSKTKSNKKKNITKLKKIIKQQIAIVCHLAPQ